MSGLYVPGKDGFQFRESAQAEERPILSYEQDSGRILLNFNVIFRDHGRKLQDIVCITNGGMVQGLILTSTAMGPEELAALRKSPGPGEPSPSKPSTKE